MVSGAFLRKVVLPVIMRNREKKGRKKKRKKKGFHFLKLFFKNENWTFIFVHF
jgi:hypothetical protein